MGRISIWRQQRTLGLLVATGIGISLLLLLTTISLIPSNPSSSPLPWVLFSSALLVTLILTGVAARRSLEKVRRDVTRLNDIAAAIASGRVPPESEFGAVEMGELDRIAESITRMKDRAEEDISSMKRLEQVRSEFLGNVSHELRTPIFTVQGFLETLLDGAADDPEVRDEFLQKAHDNLLRLHALLNDLIEISRIESGAMKMSFRYFDLIDLCRGTLHNLSDRAAMNAVRLDLRVDGADRDGKVQVYADRKRIEQALVNLLDNAIKYNRPEGEVTLSITVEKNSALIEISDNGPGIEPEHLGRIFERFYRIDRGRSREVGGSGLGLAIVKHIVDAHGSPIDVSSEPGVGTTFRFRLPRYD